MNRYFFYHFFMVGLMNLMLYVPHLLIQHRFTGAVSSLLVGAVIGSVLLYMYTTAMSRNPGKGLPELLKERHPRWLAIGSIIFFAAMWWYSAVIVIIAYARLINRFFNPDVNTMLILFLLVVAAGYAASRSSLSTMLIIEIGVIINTPIILFVLIKMLLSPELNMDAIRVVINYASVKPNLISIAAASYIFTGYINLSLFNRLLPHNFRFQHRWIYPILGFLILLASFFIPIGLHGTVGVEQYVYLWASTSDSLTMNYGFTERVMFLFLIVFMNLSLLYTMTGWHQSMEFLKSCFPRAKAEIDSPQTPLVNYVLIVIFIVVTVIYMMFANEKFNLIVTQYWLVLRLMTEISIVVWVFILTRRKVGAS